MIHRLLKINWCWCGIIVIMLMLVGCNDIARFEGNKENSNAELEFIVRRPMANWQEQQRQADLIDAAEAIRSRLDSLGYVWAEVVAKPPEALSKEGLPVFTITEGPRVQLVTVTFDYRTSADDQGPKIKDIIKHKDLREITRLGQWYTTGPVNDAPGRITRALQVRGYLSAQVSPPKVIWNAEKDQARVHYSIVTGAQFKLASETMAFSGSETMRSELTALLDPVGTVCHPRLGSECAARLRNYLANKGYRQAIVDGKQLIDVEKAIVTIALTVETGAQNIVKNLTTVGGKKTSPSFFRSHLREVVVGEPLSQEQLDNALSSLRLTGLYRQVRSEIDVSDPNDADQADADVTIQVKENRTYHVDMMAGYGSYEQLRGGVEFIDEHLFGRGLRFNTGVNASMKSWGGDAGLSDPYLLGPGRLVGINVGFNERELPSFYRQESTATFGMSQRMRPLIDPAAYEARLTYEYKRSEDFRIEAAIPGEEEPGIYVTSAIGFNIRRDARTPKIVDPDSGTFSKIGIIYSAKPLGAEIQYLELNASWSGAINPAPWLVATCQIGARTRDPIDSESLPIGERIFLGGEDSVRSFTKDDLGPRDVSGNPQGGLTSAVANIELRWRLFKNQRNIEIATFYDIGMVDPNPFSLSDTFGQGVGLGLRYRTPVGPIRLDGAYNPGNRLGAKHPWAIHLAVGFAF